MSEKKAHEGNRETVKEEVAKRQLGAGEEMAKSEHGKEMAKGRVRRRKI